MARSIRDAKLAFVLPVFNEEATLPPLYQALKVEIDRLKPSDYEIVFVNDGSVDGSLEVLRQLRRQDPCVKFVGLSRNFGHQPAINAGIDRADGDVVILMDADFQDDPAAVPALLREWEAGFDVVYAIRVNRKEGGIRRFLSAAFYRILDSLSETRHPLNAGIFSVLDRRVAAVLRRMPERNKYISGLRTYAGFRQTGVPVERLARHAGTPRQTWRKIAKLALDGLFSFSYRPLVVLSITGIFFALTGFLTVGVMVARRLFDLPVAFPQWTAYAALIAIGGLQLLWLGVIGVYIGRIYEEVKQRPYYIVAEQEGIRTDGPR